MATVNVSTDVQVTVSAILGSDLYVGSYSKFATEIHPITGKTIVGWQWDSASWPKAGSLDSYAVAPSIWDPDLSTLAETFFQSGIGDNNDLMVVGVENILNGVQANSVMQSSAEVWAPKLYHGKYFIYNEGWFLFSDSYQTETEWTTVGGDQSHTLKYNPKPGAPIQVCTFVFDGDVQRYRIARDFRKKVAFTGGTDPEFIINSESMPPTIRLNGTWEDVVGQELVLDIDGFLDPPEDIFLLEELGISNGNTNLEFSTFYSPHDQNIPTQIWTYLDPSRPTRWTVIPMIQDWALAPALECKVDPDTGLVKFGNGVAGAIPPKGAHVVAYYGKGVAVLYEPENTTDYILATQANANPVEAGYQGFVQVTTSFAGPARIVIDANLELVDGTYQLALGNNTGRVTAIVYDANGAQLDGQTVHFEIMAPVVGTFGGVATTAIATTNTAGKAQVIYNSPLTIKDVGQATATVTVEGLDTVMVVSGIVDPGTVSGLYVYKVHTSDEVLGIPASELDDYYAGYFTEEDITDETASQTWEEGFRTYNSFMMPRTYTAGELSIGKKTILISNNDPAVIDPHLGSRRSGPPYPYAPLHPSLFENIGTSELPVVRLTFDNISLPIPPADNTKSYFVVGDAETRVRAYVINRRTGSTIYSNVITIKVTIPSSVNGTFFANSLNDIPSGLMSNVQNVDELTDMQINATSGLDDFWTDYQGEHELDELYVDWFRRTRRGDTLGLTIAGYGLEFLVASGAMPSVIPMGFRLKSAGITLASMLDQITYIDPNDNLPSGYWPADWYED